VFTVRLYFQGEAAFHPPQPLSQVQKESSANGKVPDILIAENQFYSKLTETMAALSKLKVKKENLVKILSEFDSLIVAFSGGVDSAFLLAVSLEVLKNNLIAVTAKSPIHPVREIEEAAAFTHDFNIKHIVVQSNEMNQSEFLANHEDRCYICKKSLFADILQLASNMGIQKVAHGANMDDLKDFRPGHKASLEMGILSPLVDAGLTKDDIRLISKMMNLKTWNKPSMPCLATRIPYGTPITLKALKMVEKAENIISSLGVTACRVRHHGNIAKIEVNADKLIKLIDEQTRTMLVKKFKEIGFSHITLDLEGYVQGSLNRYIDNQRQN